MRRMRKAAACGRSAAPHTLQAEHARRAAELELRIAVLERVGQQREEDLKLEQQQLKAQTAQAVVGGGGWVCGY